MKRQTHSGPVSKLHSAWVKQVKHEFVAFLRATKFPEPIRNGTRGSTFAYPEWLIMLIAVLAVKAKLNSYMGRHRLTVEYWSLSTPDKDLPPISESQLRERLKKSGIHLENLPRSFFRYFLRKRSAKRVVSADKMMVKARGPVWHKKQKAQGLIPKGLTGLDRAATWSYSQPDGWVYGHVLCGHAW